MIDNENEIEELINKDTEDGPGDLDDLPEENFDSFATDDVEIEADDE